MVQCISMFSQESKPVLDTILIQRDSLVTDTILKNLRGKSSNAIDQQVTYSAGGYIKNDLINKKAFLVKSAVVNYGEIEIKADSIVFNMGSNQVFAIGIKDSTGRISGKPVFKEGSQQFEADELTYNFKTRKALIKNIITKQDDGLIHSQVTKLLEDGTSNIAKSTYSTCDADTPHFYIRLPKAKVYPGKKIISGPGNLVIAGIPLPLFIPFGYFPIQKKLAASGILIPRIGEERERGYSLTEGGYYFAVSDYFDLSMKGNLYANGTWMATAQSNYNKLYKYSGNFSFSYANNISGHKGLPDYSKASNYRLGWTYSQNAKASPGSRFSANVNMSSSAFDQTNSYLVAEHVTTQRQSSVSYSKNWEGTPFNFAASINHSQNVKNKTVSLNLPKLNFNMGRIYPLKGKKSTGTKKWYQELQFQYSASLDNQINTYDSILFTKNVFKNMRNGFKHEAPLSLQIRPFRNFSISPQVSYSGVLYTQKIEKRWENNKVINDTASGFFYGQAIRPSISASFNPQVFGTFLFTKPDSRVQAIRHVIKPSVGFSYVPAFNGLSTDMYRWVQADTTGRETEYSIFESNIYGTPSLSKRSGNISFSLTNLLEAKVFEKNDTTGKPKKVKLIDNFGITTSYNIFADSMRWAPVSMIVRTTLFNSFNISASSSFSLYGIDSKGRPINTFAFSQNGKLMRLNNFSTSLDFNLSELLKGKKARNNPDNSQNGADRSNQGLYESSGQAVPAAQNQGTKLTDEYGYSVFNVPWSLNVSYTLNYTKSVVYKTPITQNLSFNGNLTLTKAMSITYTSGYDFTKKQITMTQIGINRDLHCWDMSVNWIPNGSMQMWNFTLRVKASVLSDLKYERRKDFHDNY